MIATALIGCTSHSDSKRQESPNGGERGDVWYTGHSIDSSYKCHLKIAPDSSVVFVYELEGNHAYGEHRGRVQSVGDSLLRFNMKLMWGQFLMKSWNEDTLYLRLGDTNVIDKDALIVQYANGQRLHPYVFDEGIMKYPVNRKLFVVGKPITILTNHIHPFTQEPIVIEVTYRSSADFVFGYEHEFEALIMGDRLITVGRKPYQTGPIILSEVFDDANRRENDSSMRNK